MRPTFLGFEAAKTGVFASQKALDIVGHNLSNINTEGYTRQRVDQVSQSVAGYNNRLKPDLASLSGMGTYVEGVSQLRDERLDNAYRNEYVNAGFYSQQSTMLTDIESIMQELEVGTDGNGYGLSYAVKSLYTALEDFSYNADSETDANVFANAVSNVTQTLNRLSENLTKSANQYKEELQIKADEVNTMLSDIADLNASIRRSIASNNYTDQYGPNELKDQRNLLLDKLSYYGALRVEEQNDGTITVEMNGHKCVWDTEYDTINYQENNNNTVQLNWKSDGSNAAKDNGAFKATVDILNGRGIGVTSSTESTVNGYLYYQDKLDAFADRLTAVLNNSFPETYDENGNVLTYKKLVGETVETEDGYEVYPDMLVSAKNISITKALSDDSSYLLNEDRSTNNTHLLELINKLSSDDQTFTSASDKFVGTFQEFVADYTGTLGSDNSYAEGRYQASMTMINEIQDNRDSISGVSESEETVNMMTYNRSFQAAARMMTVMDDLLDVIINKMAV
ncbi:flagellar hook-associated protein FlgK [Porcipelethomonas sp.]|uniref:flagellar hook-associated protein FlgK n=1 Tax=Porcipelethomonas sp. TaxID=2981675 RepID=UPI003EF82A02